MRINGNAIRPGNVIEHKGGLWVAVKIQHTQPGKGGAYLQVELKNLRDGSKLNERFRASENVEQVRLEQREHQFLYAEDNQYNFMDQESYEQITLDSALVGNAEPYLQDGIVVIIESYEGSPLGITLPEHITLTVAETEPAVKGQTATSSFKPAIMENGLRVMVPPFINVDEKIVVSTSDSTYSKRAED